MIENTTTYSPIPWTPTYHPSTILGYGLAVFSSFVLFIVVFQLLRIIYYRLNGFFLWYLIFLGIIFFIINFFFLLHCVVWSVAKTIYWWLDTTHNHEFLFLGYILQSIATVFFYSTFVCLALFFTMLVYKCSNNLTNMKRKIIISLFILLDITYISPHFYYLYTLSQYLEDKPKRKTIEYNFMAFSGIMFVVLDIIIVASGSYLSYLMGISKFKIPFFKQKFWILFFTISIGILFFSRGLYYIMFISEIEFEYIDLEDQLNNQLQIIVISLLILWEIFPIFFGCISVLEYTKDNQNKPPSSIQY